LSISQASTMHWPLTRALDLYVRSGVRRIAPLLRKLEDEGLDASIERIRASGLAVDNFAVGPVFDVTRREQWSEARSRMRALFDAARALHTGCVVITTGAAGRLTWEEAADALAEALAPSLAEAQGQGIEIAIEHTNGLRFDISFLHNLRDSIDLAQRIGFRVCMEVNNAWGERALGDTIARGVANLRIVQLNDFVVGTLSTPDRAVPGDGDIPLERILSQLEGAGYAGPFELEIVGPRIEKEGYESAVARSLAYLTGLLERIGA
jgi:sugar phosphate isomerase/epimerase